MLAINLDLTAEQRLHKCVVGIMSNPRYIAMAGILMMGERTIDETIPTACTNGRDEMYGRAFVDSLSDAELRFVILHECKHKMYRHLTTWKHLHDKDHMCANMSCDYVINLEIADENPDGFATMPLDENGERIGLLDERFRNMSSQEVFNIIYKEKEEQDDGEGGEGGEGETLDSHDWEGAQEMSDADKRQLEQEIDQAIRQGALTAGKMGADMPRGFEQLLQPQIDWREVMREFVSATCTGKDYSTYNRPNRRFMSAGMYMPSAVSEQVGELVVAIDTSGSIGDTELTAFLSELKSICDTVNPTSVRLLYWGHEVVGDEKYGEMDTPIDQLVTSTKPQGGGGTDVNCVCDYIREKNINAEAVVVLTDGYLAGDWGTWTQPLLWCILDNKNASPSVGKYVHIKL